jgi:hypothetical protein
MAREPFSANGDASGTSGVSGYGTTDARSPALGRSSRDLASDTGPGAAAQELFTAPDNDIQTTTGAGRGRTTGDEPSLRDRKANPDVDPDTRLGLRPATGGMVAPRQPAFPDSGPRTRAATGAVAGLIGGLIAAVAWYGLHWTGAAALPPSLAVARWGGRFGGVSASVIGILGSVVAAVGWGALFGLLVRKPTVLKGMVFGFLPALFQWLVLAPLSRQPLFFGATAAAIGLPVLFCVLVWGGITGYFCGRWLRPPYSGAVDPDLTSAVPT